MAEQAYHVDIQSWAENKFVRGLIPANIVWVSIGYKRDTNGNFVWDRTNVPGVYAYWDDGEPNNSHGVEGCTTMYGSQKAGLWNDVPCHIKVPYICKRGKSKKEIRV